MTDLLSYGKQIRCGMYALHSKFDTAANFISEDSFAFVVDSRTGAGPLNIVLGGKLPGTVNSLEVRKDSLCLDNEEIPLRESLVYDSTIPPVRLDICLIQRNLQIFERLLVTCSPPKSLAFLLDEKRKPEFTSAFDIALVERCEDGVRQLLDGEYMAGGAILKGLGYGFTPAGDDFISGFLIAMHVCQESTTTDLHPVIGTLYRSARGGNAFVNTFLACAARGHVSRALKNLIFALCSAEAGEIEASTLLVLSHGATSGADQAVGFLIGMKRFIS